MKRKSMRERGNGNGNDRYITQETATRDSTWPPSHPHLPCHHFCITWQKSRSHTVINSCRMPMKMMALMMKLKNSTCMHAGAAPTSLPLLIKLPLNQHPKHNFNGGLSYKCFSCCFGFWLVLLGSY